MPTILGRRCPRCGGQVISEAHVGKPHHRMHTDVSWDHCVNPKCGWQSTERLPEAPEPQDEAEPKAAPEDVAN